MVCNICNRDIQDNLEYCPNCGSRIKNGNVGGQFYCKINYNQNIDVHSNEVIRADNDEPDTWLIVLSVIMGIMFTNVYLVFAIIFKDKYKKLSQVMLIALIIRILIYIIVIIATKANIPKYIPNLYNI